ncbi:MAG: tyrosine-type recombinase/integrase [Fuerstiella sp.]|nr:tyrosine-type recombinase/integrase [Fuerstiella sp.]
MARSTSISRQPQSEDSCGLTDWTGPADSFRLPRDRSAGRRTLPLSKGVEDLLHERRKAAMKSGHASKQDPIFANTRGGMVRQGNFRHKIWRKALMDADVEYKKPYTLRHTSATWMLNSGECSLAAVSKWLGHEDKVTTLRLYDHLMTGELQEVAKWWTKLQRA